MSERIGVFGGTFDPPHLGHLILAAEAFAQLRLDRVLWVLTADPPHKQGIAVSALDDRLEMVRRTIADESKFELSTVDIDRPGPHYTVDTLDILRRQNSAAEIIMLLGGDSLHDLPKWSRPELLLAECDEIGVMRRPIDEINTKGLEADLPGIGKKLRFVDAPLLQIASHDIRERIKRGLPYKYYVPGPVYDYIHSRGLYGSK
jgi:nicotinate-nucleotide adenylyltransferase